MPPSFCDAFVATIHDGTEPDPCQVFNPCQTKAKAFATDITCLRLFVTSVTCGEG